MVNGKTDRCKVVKSNWHNGTLWIVVVASSVALLSVRPWRLHFPVVSKPTTTAPWSHLEGLLSQWTLVCGWMGVGMKSLDLSSFYLLPLLSLSLWAWQQQYFGCQCRRLLRNDDSDGVCRSSREPGCCWVMKYRRLKVQNHFGDLSSSNTIFPLWLQQPFLSSFALSLSLFAISSSPSASPFLTRVRAQMDPYPYSGSWKCHR